MAAVTPAAAAQTLLARRAAHAEVAATRADAIRARLPAAATRLRDQFGARRVWCFGSLVAGTPHESSDADLAVEGIDPARVDAAAAALEAILGCSVDLVMLESAAEMLRVRVLTEGCEL